MRKRNRFLPLWLLPGIPVVTLAWHYRLDSEPALVQQTRKELATQAARVNQAMAQSGVGDPREVHDILQNFVKTNAQAILWIQFRDAGGTLRGFAGTAAASAFTMDFVRAQFRNHRPIYKLMHTRRGAVLVEAFPIRLVRNQGAGPAHLVSDREDEPVPSGVIEIATRLSRATQAKAKRSDYAAA